jgi:tetratricopeptide (TPR) repeat protein
MNRHERRANAKLQRVTFRNQLSGQDSDAANAHSELGLALRAQGKPVEAIAAFRRAIELDPEQVLFHFNLGATSQECGRLDEAIEAYRQAIRVKPGFAEAYANLGGALRDRGKPDEALTVLRQAIKLKPALAQAYANLGAALNDQGKIAEAVSASRHAIALKPDFDVPLGNLGSALMELGQLSESRAALERAVQLAPRNVKHRRYLGELDRYVNGDVRLTALERLAQNATLLSVNDRIELHFALGKAYDDLGQHAKAFGEWRDGNALKRRQIAYDEPAELRAFDRIRSVLTPDLMRAWQDAGHPSSNPVFIIGMPRSGTTLVEQILASHPDAFGAGELKHFNAAIDEVRARLNSSTPFPEVVRDMTGPDFRDLGARYLAKTEQLAPTAKRIVDKMPGNFRLAGLIHLALPSATIIHISRDPVDTCLSCFSKPFSSPQSFTYDLSELGRYYRQYDGLMAYWRRVLPPGRILDVRYEDVVADLEGQARRIVAHCGLAWDDRCLSFHKTERPVRTASAVQVRQPIYNSAVGRWRAFAPFLQPLLTELSDRLPAT